MDPNYHFDLRNENKPLRKKFRRFSVIDQNKNISFKNSPEKISNNIIRIVDLQVKKTNTENNE